MNRKNLLLITVALLLVALGNWLSELGVKQVDTRLAGKPELEHDYYITGFSATALDKRGLLQHRLEATQLSYFSESGTTQLTKPRVEVYEGKKVVWQISAEQGEVHQQQEEVVLQGKVRLLQAAGPTPLKLYTSQLTISPQQGHAETDRAITLTQGGNRIDAVGMELEQQSQRLLLLSKVRGRYESLAP